MQFETKVIVATAVGTPILGMAMFGYGMTCVLIDDAIKASKIKKAKQAHIKFNQTGPKIEKIKSARKRTEVYNEFENIVKKY